MKKINVNLGKDSYEILIGSDLIQSLGSYVKDVFKGKKILIITDDNLEKLYIDDVNDLLTKSGYEVNVFTFPHGEESKTLETAQKAYEKLVDMKFSRSDLIVAFGGGVVGDLAGFVAATYLRGVKFVQVPTSLLAQVDSSVGGKVAVDLPQGKNLVGAFYQPKLVVIDCTLLKTLPMKFFKDGLGEVIKYSFIKDRVLYEKLASFKNYNDLFANINEIIYTCCDIKRQIVENDQYDTGERMILNFGHTLGHAIEKVYGFSEVTHGEGVCIGMNLITKLSETKGLTSVGTSAKLDCLLRKYHLPYTIDLRKKQQMYDAMGVDKKNLGGSLNLILISEIGESFIHPSDLSFFEDLFETTLAKEVL